MRQGIEWLRKYMEEEGISQGELARRSGFSHQRVNNWFQGVSDPSWENLETLAAALGLRAEITFEVRRKKSRRAK